MNSATSDGSTPLIKAAYWGHLEVVRLLLEHLVHGEQMVNQCDIQPSCQRHTRSVPSDGSQHRGGVS